jgi:hypothetical protein
MSTYCISFQKARMDCTGRPIKTLGVTKINIPNPNPFSGFTTDTTRVEIVDTANKGSGAYAIPVVSGGRIVQITVVNPGRNYIGNDEDTPSTTTDVRIYSSGNGQMNGSTTQPFVLTDILIDKVVDTEYTDEMYELPHPQTEGNTAVCGITDSEYVDMGWNHDISDLPICLPSDMRVDVFPSMERIGLDATLANPEGTDDIPTNGNYVSVYKPVASVMGGEPTPSQSVSWFIEGNSSANTTIDVTGQITIAEDELASSIKITATSLFDSTLLDSCVLYLKPHAVVHFSPTHNTYFVPCTDLPLTTWVWGSGASTVIPTLSISGQTSTQTTIADNPPLLHAGCDETADPIQVLATYTQTVDGVTYTTTYPLDIPIAILSVEPECQNFVAGQTLSYTAWITVSGQKIDVTNSLDTIWSVSAPEALSSNTQITQGLLSTGADEKNDVITITVSYMHVDNYVTTKANRITWTVAPEKSYFLQGGTQTFIANLNIGTAGDNPCCENRDIVAPDVSWHISAFMGSNTNIDGNGVLYTDVDEIMTVLTITVENELYPSLPTQHIQVRRATVVITPGSTATTPLVMERGDTQQFTIELKPVGENVFDILSDCTYSISGNTSANTTFVNGLLTIGANETSTNIVLGVTYMGVTFNGYVFVGHVDSVYLSTSSTTFVNPSTSTYTAGQSYTLYVLEHYSTTIYANITGNTTLYTIGALSGTVLAGDSYVANGTLTLDAGHVTGDTISITVTYTTGLTYTTTIRIV